MCFIRLTVRDAPDRSPEASLSRFEGRAWGIAASIAAVLILGGLAEALGLA